MLPCTGKPKLNVSMHRIENHGTGCQQYAPPIMDISWNLLRKQKHNTWHILTSTETSNHHKKIKKLTRLIDDLIIYDYVNSWNKNLYMKKLIKSGGWRIESLLDHVLWEHTTFIWWYSIYMSWVIFGIIN